MIMIISNYQIHNVLKVFTSQLSKGRAADQQKRSMRNPLSDTVSLASASKKQGLIDRVSADIVKRITRKDAQEDIDREMVDRLPDEVNGDHAAKGDQKRQFVYNVLTGDATKVTRAISVDGSDFLIDRLEQLADESAE
jgi:hypothetical protein